jgi:PAS domain S-box-containing protein
MAKDESASQSHAAQLRRAAEEIARQQPEELEKMSREEMQRVLHELHVHQIELEMQNDELRRTLVELEDARDRYRDLYDFAPVGYLTLDDHNIIREANLTATTMLGVERARLLNQPLSHFIARSTQATFYLFRKLVLDTQTRQVCELKIAKSDQSEFDAALEGIVARRADGALACRVSFSDITERKEAQAVLKRSHDELEKLVQKRTASLEIFTKAAVDRELRMIELKKVINELRAQLKMAGIEPVADDPLASHM